MRYKSEDPIGDEKNDVASQKGSIHVRSQGSIAENAQNMVQRAGSIPKQSLSDAKQLPSAEASAELNIPKSEEELEQWSRQGKAVDVT